MNNTNDLQKTILRKRIEVATGKRKADFVIKNASVLDVFSGNITKKDIAISDGYIAGLGSYSGEKEYDATGLYALPGYIESHIHIESSFTTPEEFSRLMVPHGTTTAIADPHEIVNVCGMAGFKYMMEAAKNAAMDIKYQIPSCVPSTAFEHNGATVNAKDMEEYLSNENVLGLGEFMNAVGVVNCDDEVLNKLTACKSFNKVIDGHSPGLLGKDLTAYIASGVKTDHECSTIEEMQQRIENGMYVQLRNGSACKDLEKLLPAVTKENSRRCLLCSDDRQPVSVFGEGDIDDHLRICVAHGIPAVTAVQMATLNASECYGLNDRGAIAPSRRADIVLVDNLKDFNAKLVVIKGNIEAENGEYKREVVRADISAVRGSVHIKDFSADSLKMHLKSDDVYVMDISPGSIVTGKGTAHIKRDSSGDYLYNPSDNITKMAVIERHHNTGNVGLGFLRGYGIKRGALAITISHDSHNVIAVGVDNESMALAVKEIERIQGGIVLVNDGKVLDSLSLPVAGLMSDKSGEYVRDRLAAIHKAAVEQLGVNPLIEPVMTLCFMSLPVIPEIKLTDMGLFDVRAFDFI
nr:adenine deaminase [Treponema sp.]